MCGSCGFHPCKQTQWDMVMSIITFSLCGVCTHMHMWRSNMHVVNHTHFMTYKMEGFSMLIKSYPKLWAIYTNILFLVWSAAAVHINSLCSASLEREKRETIKMAPAVSAGIGRYSPTSLCRCCINIRKTGANWWRYIQCGLIINLLPQLCSGLHLSISVRQG